MMKKQLLKIAIWLPLFFGVQIASAQFTLTGEIRPRTEWNHGAKELFTPDQKGDVFTEQRSRLNFGYNDAKKYKIGIVLQDVRTWGSQKQLNKSDALLAIHEAWAEVFLSENLSLKVGRQELVYDDHRILGNVAWAQQARSHDLALFKYEDNFKLHAGFAYNQNDTGADTKYDVKNYKAMQFLWFNKTTEKINFSILALNNGVQGIDGKGELKTHFGQTIGTRLVFKGDPISFSAAAYYQVGKIANSDSLKIGLEQKINASDIMFDVTFKATDKIKFIAGYERLSGTDRTSGNTSDTNNSFNPLYGTNHKFNGFMDYFYVGNHGNNVGLQDIYLKAKFAMDKHSFGIDYHYFLTAADLAVNSKLMSSGLGSEIDISWGYKVSKEVNLKAGVSTLFATETMEALKGGSKDENNSWGWMMLIVKPNFLAKKVEGK